MSVCVCVCASFTFFFPTSVCATNDCIFPLHLNRCINNKRKSIALISQSSIIAWIWMCVSPFFSLFLIPSFSHSYHTPLNAHATLVHPPDLKPVHIMHLPNVSTSSTLFSGFFVGFVWTVCVSNAWTGDRLNPFSCKSLIFLLLTESRNWWGCSIFVEFD